MAQRPPPPPARVRPCWRAHQRREQNADRSAPLALWVSGTPPPVHGGRNRHLGPPRKPIRANRATTNKTRFPSSRHRPRTLAPRRPTSTGGTPPAHLVILPISCCGALHEHPYPSHERHNPGRRARQNPFHMTRISANGHATTAEDPWRKEGDCGFGQAAVGPGGCGHADFVSAAKREGAPSFPPGALCQTRNGGTGRKLAAGLGRGWCAGSSVARWCACTSELTCTSSTGGPSISDYGVFVKNLFRPAGFGAANDRSPGGGHQRDSGPGHRPARPAPGSGVFHLPPPLLTPPQATPPDHGSAVGVADRGGPGPAAHPTASVLRRPSQVYVPSSGAADNPRRRWTRGQGVWPRGEEAPVKQPGAARAAGARPTALEGSVRRGGRRPSTGRNGPRTNWEAKGRPWGIPGPGRRGRRPTGAPFGRDQPAVAVPGAGPRSKRLVPRLPALATGIAHFTTNRASGALALHPGSPGSSPACSTREADRPGPRSTPGRLLEGLLVLAGSTHGILKRPPGPLVGWSMIPCCSSEAWPTAHGWLPRGP